MPTRNAAEIRTCYSKNKPRSYDKRSTANGSDGNSSMERSGELFYLLTLQEIETGS